MAHRTNIPGVGRTVCPIYHAALIRTVQELLGHESVETTQIYLHVMKKPGLGVKSPLDGLNSAW